MDHRIGLLLMIAMMFVTGLVFNVVPSEWVALAIVTILWLIFFYLENKFLKRHNETVPE